MRHKNIKKQKLNHTVLQMAADPQVAEKGQIQENRDFSLPYVSHNVHYTKIMQSKNKTALLFWL